MDEGIGASADLTFFLLLTSAEALGQSLRAPWAQWNSRLHAIQQEKSRYPNLTPRSLIMQLTSGGAVLLSEVNPISHRSDLGRT